MKQIVPALVLIALAAAGWVFWPKGVSDEALSDDSDANRPETAEDIDSFLGLDNVPPESEAETTKESPGWEGSNLTEAERSARRARRQERRSARRERWQNASPEERKRWAERRVSIEPLGDAPPEIEALDVLDAMRELRPQMRTCVRENGGFRALRDAMRSADAGPRGGLSISFELSANGDVNEGSLAINPAPPAAYYECFEQTLRAFDAPVPGGDGAAVEMKMGRRGRRGTPREETLRGD